MDNVKSIVDDDTTCVLKTWITVLFLQVMDINSNIREVRFSSRALVIFGSKAFEQPAIYGNLQQ